MKFLTSGKKILLASVIAGIGATSAHAYEPYEFNGYVGGNYGALAINDSEFDDDSNAYQLKVGTDVLPFLGIELGYHDFGESGNAISSLDIDGYSLAAVGNLPINEAFGLYAKAGSLWWDADFNLGPANGDANENDFFYGVGANFEMAENLDLVVGYDRFKIDIDNALVGGSGDLESDLDFASVGVNLSF